MAISYEVIALACYTQKTEGLLHLLHRHTVRLRLPVNAKHMMKRAEITKASLLSIPAEF